MMLQKENILKMQMSGVPQGLPMMPPNFLNLFPGHTPFRGFLGKFGARFPPARFHHLNGPGMMDKTPFPGPMVPPPGFPLLSPDHNISMRYNMELTT